MRNSIKHLLVILSFISILAATETFAISYDASQFVLGSNSGGLEQQVADDFLLSHPSVMQNIEWWGGVFGQGLETQSYRSFDVRLYKDFGGTPSDTPFFQQTVSASVVDTGVDGTNPNFRVPFRIFSYSAITPTTVLDAGTRYWFSVLNNDATPNSQWVWQAASFQIGEGVYRRDGDLSSWIFEDGALRNAMAFNIPEPETYYLLLISCIFLIIFYVRKQLSSEFTGQSKWGQA